MIEGQRVSPIKLRKGDLLTEFQAVFNEFITYYNEKSGLAPASDRMNDREAAILEQVTQVRAACSRKSKPWQPRRRR